MGCGRTARGSNPQPKRSRLPRCLTQWLGPGRSPWGRDRGRSRTFVPSSPVLPDAAPSSGVPVPALCNRDSNNAGSFHSPQNPSNARGPPGLSCGVRGLPAQQARSHSPGVWSEVPPALPVRKKLINVKVNKTNPELLGQWTCSQKVLDLIKTREVSGCGPLSCFCWGSREPAAAWAGVTGGA